LENCKTELQAQLLQMLSCDNLQEHYFCKPLTTQGIDKQLAGQKHPYSDKMFIMTKEKTL